jgi:hypothetical protein
MNFSPLKEPKRKNKKPFSLNTWQASFTKKIKNAIIINVLK